MVARRGRRPTAWHMGLVLLCFQLTAVTSVQNAGSGSSDTPTTPVATTATPTTTAPATTAPATTAPATTAPATTAPATTSPTPTTTAPTTTAPSPTTAAPSPTTTTATSTATTAPAATVSTAPAATTAATLSPATTTAAPVVEHYNSSTLPPGVDSSMLGGDELVTVEVTETTLGDGTTSYSYVVITRSGGTEKTIVLTPTTSSTSSIGSSSSRNSSGGAENKTAAQSGSSQSDPSSSTKSSSSISVGAIAGIIVAAVVFMLVLFAFFMAQRRRNNQRSSDASSEDFLESPVVGKHARRLDQGQSPADTEYQEMTRTTAANSRSSGSSMPDGRRHRSTLWEDPVILASRIPIDRIELGTVISRGAFGEVYRGRYREHDVAIKTLLPEKRKDLAHIQAFLSEVRLMATMEHPHIVQFIGVAWESLSDLFCVTEFMAGGDLRSLLKDYLATGVRQGMDASKVQIAYQVAYALTYLHSLEPVVLHRDLKSRNILLTENLDAKITDFGASRIRSDATMTAGVGSSLWMAPEVMMGRRYGEKADVFSLGVVISELDTHELPYSHAKESGSSGSGGRPLPDTAVLQMVSLGKLRVRFSAFMDPDMARFVGSCVNVDPRDRPTAAEVLYYLQVAARNRQY
ncbi:TKL protein kinase [Phytophthora cinnamomi]|uniref:TKL protein kinase n=1 Tax=Phytophthora cinnamomi TaxID=4785 RepID=UPI003559BA63|nr:TKL protein kinase [Phytophthora cinnamomi]